MNALQQVPKFYSAGIAAITGGFAGALVWWTYWNVPLKPDSGWTLIASSSVMRSIHNASNALVEAAVILVTAFPAAVPIGLCAGLLSNRFRYPRVFCYAALIYPFLEFSYAVAVLAYMERFMYDLTIQLWNQLKGQQTVFAAVFFWYFTSLFLGRASWKRLGKLGSKKTVGTIRAS